MRFFTAVMGAALLCALVSLGSGQVPQVRADFADVTFTSEPFIATATFPTSLAFAPDGRLFYNERCGAVRVVEPDGDLLATPFATIPSVACSGDYGLVGLAFDPDYATNQYVYVSYMRTISTGPLVAKAIVQRFTDVNNVGTNPTEIINNFPLTNPSTNPLNYHGINSINFGPDGKLYISLGENNNKAAAQTVDNPLGKILRVNKEDGSAPADNPFFNTPGADQRVYAYGFRNTFDFDFHPANGSFYATENGFNTCDELNLIEPGNNYEWPTPFDPDTLAPLGPTCTSGVGTAAIYLFRFFEWQDGWSHNSTSAPTGILGITAEQFPALGDAFFVCEYRNSVLRLLQLGGPDLDQVIAEPRVIQGTDACRIDIEMSPSGDIYYNDTDSIRRLIIDSDSDTIEDKLDNCPTWPNTGQALPNWTVPLNDPDCDGLATSREEHVGTNPTKHCALNDTAHNEPPPDLWPVDFNDDQRVTIIDISPFSAVFGTNTSSPNWDVRYDLAPSGAITIVDLSSFSGFFGQSCA